MFLTEHYIVSIVLSGLIGFLFKFVWDRYLSQTSRVTRREFLAALKQAERECELKRSACQEHRWANKAQTENLISETAHMLTVAQKETDNRLNRVELTDNRTAEALAGLEGLETMRRKEIREILLSIMMVQVQICEALNHSELVKGRSVDCTELNDLLRKLVRNE